MKCTKKLFCQICEIIEVRTLSIPYPHKNQKLHNSMLRIKFKMDPSMHDRVRVSNTSKATTTTITKSMSNVLSPSQKYFTLSPTAITHLQNPALYKEIVDDEMIKHLRDDDYLTHPSSYPNTPTSASSEVLFRSIINNPMHQEFINMINSVKKDGNMIYIGFTGQNNVDDEAYQFLNRKHCSDKYGNTGLTLLTDTKNPLTTSIREKYTAKVYVIYSTFSKQAATHLELCIQQNLQSIIPGHILNRGTSTISYQHASVEYDVSSKVYRVYVTVLEGVRHAIDKGLVTFNYWKMSDTSTTNQLDDVESTREENKRLKERICTLEEENRILKQNIGYRIPMRVRTDTNNSLISILVEKNRIRPPYPANRAQGVRRSTSPTKKDLQWQSRFHELKDYKTLNKHTNVPCGYPKNPQLSTWVNNQRNQYNMLLKGKESRMTRERINLLNAIGFAWSSISSKYLE